LSFDPTVHRRPPSSSPLSRFSNTIPQLQTQQLAIIIKPAVQPLNLVETFPAGRSTHIVSSDTPLFARPSTPRKGFKGNQSSSRIRADRDREIIPFSAHLPAILEASPGDRCVTRLRGCTSWSFRFGDRSRLAEFLIFRYLANGVRLDETALDRTR